jgi:hypothetical protein
MFTKYQPIKKFIPDGYHWVGSGPGSVVGILSE